MKFELKTLATAGILALGLGTSAASAMPMVGAGAVAVAPAASLTAEKTAVVCIGPCFRRFGYYRPGFRRGYGFYHPYALYRGHRRVFIR